MDTKIMQMKSSKTCATRSNLIRRSPPEWKKSTGHGGEISRFCAFVPFGALLCFGSEWRFVVVVVVVVGTLGGSDFRIFSILCGSPLVCKCSSFGKMNLCNKGEICSSAADSSSVDFVVVPFFSSFPSAIVVIIDDGGVRVCSSLLNFGAMQSGHWHSCIKSNVQCRECCPMDVGFNANVCNKPAAAGIMLEADWLMSRLECEMQRKDLFTRSPCTGHSSRAKQYSNESGSECAHNHGLSLQRHVCSPRISAQ